jgi:hypothetical protein
MALRSQLTPFTLRAYNMYGLSDVKGKINFSGTQQKSGILQAVV